MTAAELITRLQLDFAPADTGDSEANFTARLSQIAADAVARPNTTPTQQEAGARYLLIAAQIRQLVRRSESFEAVGEVKITEGLAVRLMPLRTAMALELTASGLAVREARPMSGSTSVVSIF